MNEERVSQLVAIYQELEQLLVHVGDISYDYAGAERVVRAQALASANSDRAAVLLASANVHWSAYSAEVQRVRDQWQEEYDSVVLRGPTQPQWASRSWEERASVYRTQLLDRTRDKLRLEREQERVKGVFEAIKVLSRRVMDTRWSLHDIIEGFELGVRMREVPETDS